MSYDRVKRPTGAGTRVLCVRFPVYYGYRLSCIDCRVVVLCCLGKNDTWRVLPVKGTPAITSVTSASAATRHTTKPDSTNYR